MRIDYNTATLEEVTEHFKGCARQAIYIAKDRHKGNHAVHMKLELAHILAKIAKHEEGIARLQDELRALERSKLGN
jgi:hypothetical protein